MSKQKMGIVPLFLYFGRTKYFFLIFLIPVFCLLSTSSVSALTPSGDIPLTTDTSLGGGNNTCSISNFNSLPYTPGAAWHNTYYYQHATESQQALIDAFIARWANNLAVGTGWAMSQFDSDSTGGTWSAHHGKELVLYALNNPTAHTQVSWSPGWGMYFLSDVPNTYSTYATAAVVWLNPADNCNLDLDGVILNPPGTGVYVDEFGIQVESAEPFYYINFPIDNYTGGTVPTTYVPPVTDNPPNTPNFQVQFHGLKGNFEYNIYDDNALTTGAIQYNFDGGPTFNYPQPSLAGNDRVYTDNCHFTDPSDPSTAVSDVVGVTYCLSDLLPSGFTGDALQYLVEKYGQTPMMCRNNTGETDPNKAYYCFQMFTHTFPDSTKVNVAALVIDSGSNELTTLMDVIPGGTGFYQNGTGINMLQDPIVDIECGNWFTDPICNIVHLVIPTHNNWQVVTASFDSTGQAFNDHLGFIAFPLSWSLNTLGTLSGLSPTPSCTLNFGHSFAGDIEYDYCTFGRAAPSVWTAIQTIVIGVLSFFLVMALYRKYKSVLSGGV